MQLNIFYKVKIEKPKINNVQIKHYVFFLIVKHANVDQIIGANENTVYPNITLKEDVNLLDLAVNG
jgi:hypothetical protein